MTRRMWRWAGGLAAVGAILLALSINAIVRWQPPPDSEAVLTLDQLLGFVTAATLMVVAALILVTGFRRTRERRRHQRFMQQHRAT